MSVPRARKVDGVLIPMSPGGDEAHVRGSGVKDLGTETFFVRSGFLLPLSRCHFTVYPSFGGSAGSRTSWALDCSRTPIDEGFVAEGLASLGGVADSLDEGGVV